jgi:DNA-binding MarR family transcriptional regulator
MVLEALFRQINFKTNHDLAFQHRLARDLGMTVAELTTTMSSLEYNNWIAYYIWEKKMNDENVAMAQAEANKRNK